MANVTPIGIDESTGRQRKLTSADSVTAEGGVTPDVSRSYGELYVSSSSGTSITAGTYVKLAGTTTAGALSGFTHSNGRLTYTGTKTKRFLVSATLSTSTANPNRLAKLRIAKGGTTIAATQIDRKHATADVGASAVQGVVELATNDYVEVFADLDVSDTLTAQFMVLTAREV